MRLLAKSLIPSGEHNFASFSRNVPGLKTRTFVTLEDATLSTEISATSGSQKFLNLQIFSNLFSEKSIFRDCDVRFLEVRRCAPTEIFFWGDRHRLEVKPLGRLKSRTRPPRGVINLFSSLRDLKIYFPRKIMFFSLKTFIFLHLFDIISPRGYLRSSQDCISEDSWYRGLRPCKQKFLPIT